MGHQPLIGLRMNRLAMSKRRRTAEVMDRKTTVGVNIGCS